MLGSENCCHFPSCAKLLVDTGCLCSVDFIDEVNTRDVAQETYGAQADVTGLEGCAPHHPCKPAEAAG